MNADYINCLIHGAQNIIEAVCAERPALGKLYVKQPPYSSRPVSVKIGIIGDVQGEINYSMNEDVALYIAAKMLTGMPISILDEIARSAVSELTNMISGNVSSLLYAQKVTCDITTPSFSINPSSENFQKLGSASKVICVPLILQTGGILEVDVIFC